MSDFSIRRQMEMAKKKAEDLINKALREAILETGNSIITSAPVITGRLRHNWQTTINYKAANELAGTDAGTPLAGLLTVSNLKLNDVVYFTNNLPYAEYIEYGDYVGQGSQGEVRKAVAEFPAKLQKAVQKWGKK
jgi:hypothetical protein